MSSFHGITGRAAARGKAWPIGLIAVISLTLLLITSPLVYVTYRALQAPPSAWWRLVSGRVPGLLLSSLGLATAVSAIALLIAVPAAWLTARTDLPGRKTWQWLLSIPLVFPPYIGAYIYITLFGPRGVAGDLVSRLLGLPPELLSSRAVYNFPSVALILALYTYPYIFMLTHTALTQMDGSLDEAARVMGVGRWQRYRRLLLPLLTPAILAGVFMVALYVLADFGTVSMLRFQTFTSAIYLQLVGRYDRSAAAVLSLVLTVVTTAMLMAQWRALGRAKFHQATGHIGTARAENLGRWKWVAVAFLGIVVGAAFVIPVVTLLFWAYRGWLAGALDSAFLRYTINSVQLSTVVATAGVILAFPLAYLAARDTGGLGRVITRFGYLGDALPGIIVALGIVFVFLQAIPTLYRTLPMLAAAHLVRFIPQAMRAEEAALAQIPESLEESASTMGLGLTQRWRRITLPLMLRPLLTAWVMVFVNSMKELPTTLLLRPAGFDTLAVRVWMDTSEGFYVAAGPQALLLVLVSALPMAINLMDHGARSSSERSGGR